MQHMAKPAVCFSLALAICLALTPDAAVAQAASARGALVRDTAASCVRSQSVKPANFSRTVGAIHRYCDCYAQKLVDTLTADELKAIERDLPPAVKAKADAATAACAALAR